MHHLLHHRGDGPAHNPHEAMQGHITDANRIDPWPAAMGDG